MLNMKSKHIEARSHRTISFTLPAHAVPSMVWKKNNRSASRVDEIYSEILKPPSMRMSGAIVPSCIGIGGMLEWTHHEYSRCLEECDLIIVCALVASESKEPQSRREKIDDKPVRRGSFVDEESLLQAMSLVATPLGPRGWKHIPDAVKVVQTNTTICAQNDVGTKIVSRNGLMSSKKLLSITFLLPKVELFPFVSLSFQNANSVENIVVVYVSNEIMSSMSLVFLLCSLNSDLALV